MNAIKKINPGSIAEELGIEEGDLLLSINDREVKDIMDFIYLCHDEYIEVDIQKSNGDVWTLEIEKEYDEPLGLDFTNPIIDHARRCSNNCLFCFIDQLPEGMRETLYFKDDDSRLSFLQGNFVTLTNLKDDDINRIIEYHISPINVSVHTTAPELRSVMLGNRFAGNIMERLEQLIEGGITVNAQIVLCPGFNDGSALESTLNDLIGFYPKLKSVAIVPIGLSKHREGLRVMAPVDQKVALDTINILNVFQAKAIQKIGTRFAFLADEFYIQAGLPFPNDADYEGYIQLEDGIGMVRKLSVELNEAIENNPVDSDDPSRILLLTGIAAEPFLIEMVNRIQAVFPNRQCTVKGIVNEFFGERITVAGLVTGTDIMKQVGPDLTYDYVLMPESMFRADDTVLLDDVDIDALSACFKCPVYKVPVEGEALLKHILIGGSNE